MSSWGLLDFMKVVIEDEDDDLYLELKADASRVLSFLNVFVSGYYNSDVKVASDGFGRGRMIPDVVKAEIIEKFDGGMKQIDIFREIRDRGIPISESSVHRIIRDNNGKKKR